ncbi:hypothetical protein CDD81_4646 [Ophiocordyceps australis]|uniref:R3H-associated N-terminal domain-containing protein n=1 Tax=Ophiocordyceps australis TaxID=1399860 RepID=A0A2C5Y4K0_9HYPO|nr:hypothetical protein CDD81_4646 [Ophiocordyceps australis]
MAIYSAVPPPPALVSNQVSSHQGPSSPPPHSTSAAEVDAWTVSALQSLSISPFARGTGTPLAIAIDHDAQTRKDMSCANYADTASEPLRRPPSRRDSQRRREALLKGKEGSRQRRRWENDRLIGVPNVQPPLPSDWEVQPTHRVHHVPYQMAQFWDQGLHQRIQEKTLALKDARKRHQLKAGSATGTGIGEVPRDLRDTSKRSPVIRDWIRTLEEPLRQYLTAARLERQGHQEPTNEQDMDSDEEEIIFSGRSGAMQELKEKRAPRLKLARRQVQSQTVDSGMVYDSLGEGESAAFKRWLTHSLSNYYGLSSRSVTLAGSRCRVVYVAFKDPAGTELAQLPRPLWELC